MAVTFARWIRRLDLHRLGMVYILYSFLYPSTTSVANRSTPAARRWRALPVDGNESTSLLP